MGLLATFRHRLHDALHQHPICHDDPLLGNMEEIGDGQWRTSQAIEFSPTGEPITVSVQADPDGSDTTGRAMFAELQNRYEDIKKSIAPLVCRSSPRVRACTLWQHASLSTIEIWQEDKPVIALYYVLADDPEYTYIIRLEDFQPVDIIVTS